MIMVMQIETVNWSIVMEIKKAEIKDLDVVVKMKMEMFIEVVQYLYYRIMLKKRYMRNIKNYIRMGKVVII